MYMYMLFTSSVAASLRALFLARTVSTGKKKYKGSEAETETEKAAETETSANKASRN